MTADARARRIGKWPGVAGYTHDGAVYCVDCANDSERIPVDLSRPIDGSEVTDDSWTGAILADYCESGVLRHCHACGKELPYR